MGSLGTNVTAVRLARLRMGPLAKGAVIERVCYRTGLLANWAIHVTRQQNRTVLLGGLVTRIHQRHCL